MPCGGIFPIKAEDWFQCFHCNQVGGDHFVEEWDAVLHGQCVLPFLQTEEGRLVLDHGHQIELKTMDGAYVLTNETDFSLDPNTTLQELRERITELSLANPTALAEEVIERFEALDQWLRNGGFLPDAWNKNQAQKKT